MRPRLARSPVTFLKGAFRNCERPRRTVGGVRRTTAVLVAMLLLAAGCGDQEGASDEPAPTGPAPLTSRAIAAVMLDHLSDDTTHRQATYVDEHTPRGLVGADFRYHGDGEYDGDLVEVTVYPGKPDPAPPLPTAPTWVTASSCGGGW